jgi:hypothetical protein
VKAWRTDLRESPKGVDVLVIYLSRVRVGYRMAKNRWFVHGFRGDISSDEIQAWQPCPTYP